MTASHLSLRFHLQLAAVALLAAGFVGCGSSAPPPAAKRLPGKWQGAMIVYEDVVAGKLGPEQIEALKQQQMGLEFAPDGTMVTSGAVGGQAHSNAGRWQVVSEDGDLLSIQTEEQGGKKAQVNIEFDGGDSFYIPLHVQLAPEVAEVTEVGAMKFTRMR
jgi:hypothetical protein